MSHPNKVKGYNWEAALAKYLGCSRIGGVNGANDQGDLHDPDWVIEAKDEATIKLPEYMRELEREMGNAGKRWGVALVKNRRHSTGDGYAVMPIWLWRGLRDYLAYLESHVPASAGTTDV
jgi:hypothetical protein